MSLVAEDKKSGKLSISGKNLEPDNTWTSRLLNNPEGDYVNSCVIQQEVCITTNVLFLP